MKKVILILVIILIVSCQTSPTSSLPTKEKPLGDFVVRVVDSCEYIEFSGGLMETSVYSITHKGNCKFCKERNKKN